MLPQRVDNVDLRWDQLGNRSARLERSDSICNNTVGDSSEAFHPRSRIHVVNQHLVGGDMDRRRGARIGPVC